MLLSGLCSLQSICRLLQVYPCYAADSHPQILKNRFCEPANCQDFGLKWLASMVGYWTATLPHLGLSLSHCQTPTPRHHHLQHTICMLCVLRYGCCGDSGGGNSDAMATLQPLPPLLPLPPSLLAAVTIVVATAAAASVNLTIIVTTSPSLLLPLLCRCHRCRRCRRHHHPSSCLCCCHCHHHCHCRCSSF